MSLACSKQYSLTIQSAAPVSSAYWNMDEASGTRVNAVGDPNGDLLVIMGDEAAVPGKIGNALPFVGPFETFGTTPATLFNYDPSGVGLTWTLWFQVNPVAFPLDVDFYLSAWDLVWRGDIYDTGFKIEMFGLSTNSTVNFAQVWTPGTWYFAAVQFRGSDLKARLSINAGPWSVAPTTADVAGATTTPSQIILGSIDAGPVENIVIDEMALFVNSVLTDAQIAFLYNGGSGRTYPF